MGTITKVLSIGLLLGTTIFASGVMAELQQGGRSTNNVSSTAKGVAETARYGVMAVQGAQAMTQLGFTWFGFTGLTNALGGGTAFWAWENTDIPGAAVDIYAYMDSKNRNAKLNEDIEPLTAAVRQIGEGAKLEDSPKSMFNPQDIEIATLKNVGLEALEDVAGRILKTPEELYGAASAIQTGFGTSSVGAVNTAAIKSACSILTDATARASCEANASNVTSQVSAEQQQDYLARGRAHLQFTGTAGVARSDLGISLAASERADNDTLFSYVGGGYDLTGNLKVLVGLDLILTERLNLFNMVYGQQTANEAALALQYVTD